jgi:hypothetical protein
LRGLLRPASISPAGAKEQFSGNPATSETGYVIVDAAPGYYGDGEDAYVMEKVNK